ncbi:MAG: class I SAM-dependent methyltransferase [Chloroflexota bacterium]
MEKFEKFQSRYESGEVPWDYELPPPELIELADQLPAGRVLDLGCGYGRSCVYLAQKGWQADGVDFVPLAIEKAEQRLANTAVSHLVNYTVGPVTKIAQADQSYDLIVDIGCMHALSADELQLYAGEVERLLDVNGRYLLFAHILSEGESDDGSKGITEKTIKDLFANLHLEKVEHGVTQVEDKDPWNSAWFWFIASA